MAPDSFEAFDSAFVPGYSVECHHRQWVLEYNPLPPNTNSTDAVFAMKSTTPRVATASSDLWHERLAHCGPEVIEHLPTSMTGVKVTAGPSANECTAVRPTL